MRVVALVSGWRGGREFGMDPIDEVGQRLLAAFLTIRKKADAGEFAARFMAGEVGLTFTRDGVHVAVVSLSPSPNPEVN